MNAIRYRGRVLSKAAVDVILRRARVFPVTRGKEIMELWLSPVGMMKKEKPRVIHHLTLSGCGATVREARGTRERENILRTVGRSVNSRT